MLRSYTTRYRQSDKSFYTNDEPLCLIYNILPNDISLLCPPSPVQVPKKQVVEKPSRAIERQVIEMERKNRTYTLLEDSDSDGEASRQGGKDKKSREKDKGKKRKHLRHKRDESPLSSEEDNKKRWVLAFLGLLMVEVIS